MKRILLLLSLALVMTACGNKSKMDPNSPVSQYISLSCEWMELSHRLDNPRLTNSQESSIRIRWKSWKVAWKACRAAPGTTN